MKRDRLLNVLDTIEDLAFFPVDFTIAVIAAGYGASSGRIQYKYNEIKENREEVMEAWREMTKKERDRNYKYFYKLKKDGLIKEKTKNGSKFFYLTSLGRRKQKKLDKNKKNYVLPDISYEKIDNQMFTIVVFDIPEKDRGKRDWLRNSLVYLEFEKLQKSVWIGKIKIPKNFIKDLFDLQIDQHIEILEVTKFGTLKRKI